MNVVAVFFYQLFHHERHVFVLPYFDLTDEHLGVNFFDICAGTLALRIGPEGISVHVGHVFALFRVADLLYSLFAQLVL